MSAVSKKPGSSGRMQIEAEDRLQMPSTLLDAGFFSSDACQSRQDGR